MLFKMDNEKHFTLLHQQIKHTYKYICILIRMNKLSCLLFKQSQDLLECTLSMDSELTMFVTGSNYLQIFSFQN